MFRFNPDEDFEPSSVTKQWNYYTHKTKHRFAGITLPGLFDTTHYEWQIMGFFTILILESIATYVCWDYGIRIPLIILSIVIDIVLAISSHVFQKKICEYENNLICATREEVGKFENMLASVKFWKIFFLVLIYFSWIFKSYWFFSVYDIFDITTLAVFVFYFLGALLHCLCTGYAWYTSVFYYKVRREYNKYLNSQHRTYKNRIEYKTDLGTTTLTEARIGRHKIQKESNKYFLISSGLLTDAELRALIVDQVQSEPMRIVATIGVKHQLMISGNEPTILDGKGQEQSTPSYANN